jgi:predicted RNase H-like HicB family nuclease
LLRLSIAGYGFYRKNQEQGLISSQRMKTKTDYHINLFYSAEDGGYIADVPDLTSCSAFGETQEQALHQVLAAKLAWLAAAKKHKKPVPAPRYRPAIYAIHA